MPRVRLQWVDSLGKVTDLNWPTSVQWAWAEGLTDEAPAEPMLQIYIRLPSGSSIGAQNVVSMEARSPVQTLPLTIQRSNPGKRARSHEGTLVANLVFERPFLIVDKSCAESEIQPYVRESTGSFFFTGVSCADRGDRIEVTLHHSSDGEIRKLAGLSPPERKGKTWSLHILKKPRSQKTDRKTLAAFEVADATDDAKSFTRYLLVFEPRKSADRLSMTAGAGISLLNYSESVGGSETKLSEVALTAKASATYAIVPRMLDAGANIFMTALPLSSTTTPAGLSSARFYGVNGRLGYRLPIQLGHVDWSFLAGWYLWGMMGMGDEYGVSALSGPQIFITARQQQLGHRSYFGYLKFAPIGNQLQIALGNRELAFGGGYEISKPSSRHPVTLTIDISDARWSGGDPVTPAALRSLRLLSISLGIQIGL